MNIYPEIEGILGENNKRSKCDSSKRIEKNRTEEFIATTFARNKKENDVNGK